MALEFANITFDLSDQLGVDFDPRRTKVWITTNVPNDTVIDQTGNKIRLGSGNVTVNPDGTGQIDVWKVGQTGLNPLSWQTTVHVDYPDRNERGGRGRRDFGPFTIASSGDLAVLVAEQEVPPTYVSQVTAQLDAKVTEASGYADDAAASAAQAKSVAEIDTSDALMASVASDPASEFAQVQSATIGTEVAAGFADPGSPIGDAARDYFLVIGSQVTDTAGAARSMLDLQHNSDGSGHASQQTYGLEIHNENGARAAQVIHQYSNVGPALWIDNTDSNDTIYIHNTENLVRNPDGIGSGNPIKFVDHATTRFLVRGKGTVQIVTEATATDPGIQLSHNHAGMGMTISSASSASGYYALNISAYDQGVNVTTSQNFGLTFGITKNGTTGGDVLRVTNKGTGPTALFKTAAASVSQINPDGEFEHLTAAKGIVLKSPDGTRYRITVANGGTVSVAAA